MTDVHFYGDVTAGLQPRVRDISAEEHQRITDRIERLFVQAEERRRSKAAKVAADVAFAAEREQQGVCEE